MTLTEFRAAVEAHLTASEESATAFGKRVLGDPTFVFDLRKGRDVSLTLVERVMAAIAASPKPAKKSQPAGRRAA